MILTLYLLLRRVVEELVVNPLTVYYDHLWIFWIYFNRLLVKSWWCQEWDRLDGYFCLDAKYLPTSILFIPAIDVLLEVLLSVVYLVRVERKSNKNSFWAQYSRNYNTNNVIQAAYLLVRISHCIKFFALKITEYSTPVRTSVIFCHMSMLRRCCLLKWSQTRWCFATSNIFDTCSTGIQTHWFIHHSGWYLLSWGHLRRC